MSHWEQSVGATDQWFTPKYVFDALSCDFDLDVAAPKFGPRYVPVNHWIWEDSLAKIWQGFIWMNPPFGQRNGLIPWLNKFFNHGNGIALVPDRTSAPWWQTAAHRACCILFVDGKIKFERPDGSLGKQPGNGTCLMASGRLGVQALIRAERNGLGVLMVSKTYE